MRLHESSVSHVRPYVWYSDILNCLKSPQQSYFAKPFHPFPHNRLRHLQLYLIILCLIIAFTHQLLLSAESDPLVKGHTPVHRFNSLQSAAVLFLFLLLSVFLFLSDSPSSLLPLLPDLFFALDSALFFLQYSVSSTAATVRTSDLQANCDTISAQISALISLLCLILACQPRRFVADVGLGAAFCLQGLWFLQTGLSLYVEAFIPERCHELLDVVSGLWLWLTDFFEISGFGVGVAVGVDGCDQLWVSNLEIGVDFVNKEDADLLILTGWVSNLEIGVDFVNKEDADLLILTGVRWVQISGFKIMGSISGLGF
ncbi:uncharacterized protein LOC111989438 [Quercus suber]|uniref:uncharacterized protein LOC111989438 n=1 Tax=Quercus suber TaxID=58331 RepID=UPI0032DF1E39